MIVITKKTTGALLVLAFLAACSSSESGISDLTSAQEETSTCANSLRFAQSSNAGPNSANSYSVDYCRELVIVDNSVLTQLQGYSFKEVMALITGLEPGVELDKSVETWAASWAEAQEMGEDATDEREVVKDELLAAWNANTIDLIAITNRMDLLVPEGRLVYQLRLGNSGMEDMTIIVEFGLPLAGDTNVAMQQEAVHWHTLGNPLLTKNQYVEALKENLARFVQPARLRQLRTNEQLEGAEWQLREFKITQHGDATTLALAPLTTTPADDVRIGDLAKLATYLATPTVAEGLRTGDMKYVEDPQWTELVGVKASFDPSGRWWPTDTDSESGNEDMFLMSFNTCNGCHNGLDGNAQHIFRDRPGQNATLSEFLGGSIPMQFPLPVCRQKERPGFGCSSEGNWNEREMRTGTLTYWLDGSSQPLFKVHSN